MSACRYLSLCLGGEAGTPLLWLSSDTEWTYWNLEAEIYLAGPRCHLPPGFYSLPHMPISSPFLFLEEKKRKHFKKVVCWVKFSNGLLNSVDALKHLYHWKPWVTCKYSQ